jgi:hypothetical protein
MKRSNISEWTLRPFKEPKELQMAKEALKIINIYK